MTLRTLHSLLLASLVFAAALPVMAAFAMADATPPQMPVLASQTE